VADRLPAMCGKATLAMLESSTSMNVAIVTVSAIVHGPNLVAEAGAGIGSEALAIQFLLNGAAPGKSKELQIANCKLQIANWQTGA
ncbi:MAG TPA: hypothetical protein VFA18_16805, partial [Gemmataceae bacterium]|nr:hypothetical protein [Gemmataceae bacterium]